MLFDAYFKNIMYLCIEKSIVMTQVGNMKLYNFEELLDEDYGKEGTSERDAFERSVDLNIVSKLMLRRKHAYNDL